MELIEEDQYLLSDELLGVYGVGDDPQAAAEDLLQMLVDLHRELSSSSARLSSRLREQLKVLDYFLGRRFDQHDLEG